MIRSVSTLLGAMGVLSLVTTPVQLREDNAFSWFPIIEVAYLFIGIFITMIPALLILKALYGIAHQNVSLLLSLLDVTHLDHVQALPSYPVIA